MTQIVYDGKHLIADRKVYDDFQTMGSSIKLKSVMRDGQTLHYAFTGSNADCDIGEKVVASGFDPEVCAWAINRLGHSNLQNDTSGIVVEVPNNSTAPQHHRVYLVNYAGDKCEMTPGEFLVIGAMDMTIRIVHRTIQEFVDFEVSTANLIRFAVRGTDQTQDGYILDQVNLETGVYEEV